MDVPEARSVLRQTLSVEEIESLVGYARGADASREAARIARHWAAGPDYHHDGVDVLFHDGDLEIDGDFRTSVEPWTEMLVVHGDLIVRGLFEDCLDPESLVVVTGDLRAGNVVTTGWLEVGGDLVAGGCVLFDDNDCAEVFGNVAAGLVFTKYHHVDVHGRVVAPLIAGDWRRIESPHDYAFVEDTDARLASLLVPEILVIEGDRDGEPGEDWFLDYVDSRALAGLLRDGRSPLLPA